MGTAVFADIIPCAAFEIPDDDRAGARGPVASAATGLSRHGPDMLTDKAGPQRFRTGFQTPATSPAPEALTSGWLGAS